MKKDKYIKILTYSWKAVFQWTLFQVSTQASAPLSPNSLNLEISPLPPKAPIVNSETSPIYWLEVSTTF